MWRLLLLIPVLLSACGGKHLNDESRERLVRTHTQLGIEYFQQGELELAIQKLKRALEVDDGMAEPHNAIAIVYQSMNELDLADRHFSRAVDINPEDAAAQNNYAAFLCSQKRFDQAERHFLTAINNKFYKSPQLAYENLGLCMMAKPDLVKAEENFRAALKIDGNLRISLLQMAELNYRLERDLSARAYLQRYMAVTKPSAEALYLGMQIEQRQQAADIVSRYRQELLRRFPDSRQAALVQDSERPHQSH